MPPGFFRGAGGQVLKLSTPAVAALLALALLMTGFTLSRTLAGQSSWTLSGNGRVPEETRATRSGIPAPAAEPSIPTKDVPGTDILGLPRYPGSVRIQYMREDLNNVIWTEVEYVTAAELDTLREFYRDVFRTEGWSVGDVGFSEGTWNFFVIEGAREVYVELESRDEIVEMGFELTEAKPNKELKPEQKDEPEKRSTKSNTRASPSPAYDYDDDYGEGNDDLEGGED